MTNELSSTFSDSNESSDPNFTDHAGPVPIRLIYLDENGKFRMDPEAMNALRLLKDPVAVVSVFGHSRQRKNFILNQIVGSIGRFPAAPIRRSCTEELWIWSAPAKRTAPDGTEYTILLLGCEGIDAHEKVGTCSTEMFSLAVLLSSMFIYNQMGGIDEAALDQLSIVMAMAKHIHVKECGGNNKELELGQYSPIFVWLLMDFYLNLAEDNLKVTPRDYLELALRPVECCGKDIAARNEIRESIRALFPDRECFTLAHPCNNGNDLQGHDHIHADNFGPEFKSGLDALTQFTFERTKPKQVRGTIMTGPILVGVTKFYLDALNDGAAPSITSSWQNAEESECQKAYDMATEVYMSTFYHMEPLEGVLPREAHEKAAQESVAAFDASAIGSGSARQKYKELLQNFLKKASEDYGKDAFLVTDFGCSNAIKTMGKRLEAACQVTDAKIDHVVTFLGSMLSEYEAKIHVPEKWQKLSYFLQQSLQGPILNLVKKKIEEVEAEKSDLMLKLNSQKDKIELLNKQVEGSKKLKIEYQKHYESAIIDMKNIDDCYKSRVIELESKCYSLEEKISSLLEMLNSSKQESFEWKIKYEEMLSTKKIDDKASAKTALLKSLSKTTELRQAAGDEKGQSAQKAAAEWKLKYENAVREAEAALEKATTMQESTNKQVLVREEGLRAEFSSKLAEKEQEIKNIVAKLQYSEQLSASLSLELKAAESKLKNYDLESSTLKNQIKQLGNTFKEMEANNQSLERKVEILEEEKTQMEQKYFSEIKQFEEEHGHRNVAENKVEIVKDVLKQQTEASTAQDVKNIIQEQTTETLSKITGAGKHIGGLEEQNENLVVEPERFHVSKTGVSKVALVETVTKMRKEEIESLLKSNDVQILRLVKFYESFLQSERASNASAKCKEESLKLQLQSMKLKLDSLQQELNSVHLIETPVNSMLKSTSHGKHSRPEAPNPIQYIDTDEEMTRAGKRSKTTMSPRKCTSSGPTGYAFKANENKDASLKNDFVDYTKFTVKKLQLELRNHGYGSQLVELKSPRKKDILALYEKHVLQKN